MHHRIRGWEPPGFEAIRDQYWARTVWLTTLEIRIQMTDAGLAWLDRVKRIGRKVKS